MLIVIIMVILNNDIFIHILHYSVPITIVITCHYYKYSSLWLFNVAIENHHKDLSFVSSLCLHLFHRPIWIIYYDFFHGFPMTWSSFVGLVGQWSWHRRLLIYEGNPWKGSTDWLKGNVCRKPCPISIGFPLKLSYF